LIKSWFFEIFSSHTALISTNSGLADFLNIKAPSWENKKSATTLWVIEILLYESIEEEANLREKSRKILEFFRVWPLPFKLKGISLQKWERKFLKNLKCYVFLEKKKLKSN